MIEPVKLISATQDAEKLIAYIARVSNPKNQTNSDFKGLLKYCIAHGHWSVFEQAHMTLEINTTRAIAAQILRHRSFTFQEFSQRYADKNLLGEDIPIPELRRQDTKNRQNSIDDIDEITRVRFEAKIEEHFYAAQHLYNELLDAGIAKECARMILPLSAPTRIYMTGSVRSWIHYIELRSGHGTQSEHMVIAEGARRIFNCTFPTIASALGWSCPNDDCNCEDIQPSLRID